MLLTMGVSLYTSRLILQALGMVDYGIYSVVGGVVTLLSFFNGAMATATQRYLSYDIGKGDINKLKQTFNATLNIHFGIALVVLILAEILGLWYVNYKLNVPEGRMIAVNWVYQFSIFSFLLSIIQVPYNALLIARERMSIYAYMSVAEVLLKLLFVVILLYINTDKLILYGFLTFLVSFIIQTAYRIYCKKRFAEVKYKFYFNKAFYKELLSYSGWNLFGNIAVVAKGQGNNMVLNLFFGPVVNAAYGITNTVQGAVNAFIGSFQTAVNPQIVKNYAIGNSSQFLNLIFKSARLSYLAMLIPVVPILYNVDYILKVWLKTPPSYTHSFIVLCLFNVLIDCISNPLIVGAMATGKIKMYQIVVGTLLFFNLPISYTILHFYKEPTVMYWVGIGISFIALCFRLNFLQNMVGLSIKKFIIKVGLKIIITSIILYIIFRMFQSYWGIADNLLLLIIQSLVLVFFSVFCISLLGLDKRERQFGYNFVVKKIKNDCYKKYS
jgi:O-antigen/teichoic acid export membrane protein